MPQKTSKAQDEAIADMTPGHVRRVLGFLNDAASPLDLIETPLPTPPEEHLGDDDVEDLRLDPPRPLLDPDSAKALFRLRDEKYPLGFTHLEQLREIRNLDILHLLHWLGPSLYGEWHTLPYQIVNANNTPVGVVHAALLHTSRVLFIADDGTTPIWDPADETNPQFTFPASNPSYSLICSGNTFLSDGQLLAVGGGGFGRIGTAVWGWKFDPAAATWTRTTGPMAEDKWYPTAVTTGDNRVLVVCGNSAGEMEMYDEATDTFSGVTGDTLGFPNLYPGLHLLPNNMLFYSRTGWGRAFGNPPVSSDNSAYFTFSAPNAGTWNSVAPSALNRCKGMSVMILQNAFPYVRILVVGGSDATGAGINGAEIIDASGLSATSAWTATTPVPDTITRRQCNAALLPDNSVFVAGGADAANSPCMLFDPSSNGWRAMAALPSIRKYHSVMLLLPSGKVMMAGWANDGSNASIDIYSPPYLFRGARPTISNAPAIVHHGQAFTIESPEAATVVKVVLVRPMAVTHQTDTNQRVIEMPYIHDHAHPTNLGLTAPNGVHPHAVCPQGYYMLFVINIDGVPSQGRWIYLH